MENQELNNIMQQIAQLESQIAIKKNTTEQLKEKVNSKMVEQQTELSEVERLKEINNRMQQNINSKQKQINDQNNKVEFDSFLNDMKNILR